MRPQELEFGSLFDKVHDAVIVADAKTQRIVLWNPAAEKILGYSASEALGMRVEALVPEYLKERYRTGMSRYARTGHGPYAASDEPLELSALHKGGKEIWVEFSLSPLEPADERMGDGEEGPFFLAIMRDVTERKRAQELHARLAAIVESSDDAIIGNTLEGIITSWNRGAERMYGYTAEEAIGRPISMLVPADKPDEVPEILKRIERGEKVENYETRRPTKDGRMLDVSLTISPISGSEGNIVGASTIARDITERKRAQEKLRELEERLRYMAFHDPLTGLPNRTLFTDRVKQALARLKRREDPVAVLFLDLDDFKQVNDSLGHEAGDRVLVEVAERLKNFLRPEDTVARFGGDEFTVLLEGVAEPNGVSRAAERILDALRRPLTLEGRQVSTSASIGVAQAAVPPQEGPQQLLRVADLALYEAKKNGKAQYKVLDASPEGVLRSSRL